MTSLTPKGDALAFLSAHFSSARGWRGWMREQRREDREVCLPEAGETEIHPGMVSQRGPQSRGTRRQSWRATSEAER